MVAEFMAQGAKECSKRRDLLPHRRPHPYSDQHGLGIEVAARNSVQARRTATLVSSFIADSTDFPHVRKHSSCGRSRVLIRSLSRNPAPWALRGEESVSIAPSSDG